MPSFKTVLASCLALPIAGAAIADTFPSRPLTLVVPFAAGGSTDVMARAFAEALGDELGQRVLVQVMPGAGGVIGATAVAQAAADGYTILFTAAPALLWPPLTQEVGYGIDSFAYVAKLTDFQQALITRADAPFSSLEELIALSRTRTVTYADQSPLSRAFVEAVATREGIGWNGIPTAGGGEMMPFLLGGHVDFAWSGGVHQRHGDQITVLLSMNAERLEANPDVPSLRELYGIHMPSEALLAVPADTPAEIVETLAAHAERAMAEPRFVELMTGSLMFPLSFAGPAEISAAMAASNDALQSVLTGQ